MRTGNLSTEGVTGEVAWPQLHLSSFLLPAAETQNLAVHHRFVGLLLFWFLVKKKWIEKLRLL